MSVLTPLGPRPAANVHEIPVGGTVRQAADEIHLLDANGNIVHVARHGPPSLDNLDWHDDEHAYIPANAWYSIKTDKTKPEAITKSVASWRVPPAPAKWSGDTLFYSFGLLCSGPSPPKTWLQPSLQYGVSAAGGGRYWSTVVWHLTMDHAYYTTATKVLPGTDLTAVISSVPDTKRYIASILSHAPGPTYVAEFDVVFTSTIVSIGPSNSLYTLSTDYPAPTVFGPIEIGVKSPGSMPPDVTWTLGTPGKYTSYLSVSIDKAGVDNSQITIYCKPGTET